MKKLLAALGAFVGAAIAASVAFSGGMPLLPSNPIYSEPNQIVGTLNTLLNTLNGAPTALNNNTPAVVSLGAFSTCTAASPGPATCNSQRGVATITAGTVAGNSGLAVTISNSLVTTTSVCQANLVSFSGTFITNGTPFVSQVVPTAGTLTVGLANGSATSTGSTNFGIAFNCIQ